MPELPEVETTLRGIQPYVQSQTVTKVIIRHYGLRWPIPKNLIDRLTGQTIHRVERRAKYLLLYCDNGTLVIHLGMSGRLSVLDTGIDHQKHDHVDIELNNGFVLRFTDTRRFGAVLWTEDDPLQHSLINHLGPEPLSTDFTYDYLQAAIKNRTVAIKTAIMNGEIVVGVGNIYANEALHLSGIHPKKPANKVNTEQLKTLVTNIKFVLEKAIKAGGTTLKDFRQSDGTAGYFAQELHVYGRNGQKCDHCEGIIEVEKLAQRATYYCPLCQVL
jgi:formamidopyrimidine-DNA glycosylase